MPSGVVARVTATAASMGPPLFRGGHWYIANEALSITELQWGHLSLEVVIGLRGAREGPVHPASMGPPLFRGGHPSIPSAGQTPPQLQWGHLSLEVVIWVSRS